MKRFVFVMVAFLLALSNSGASLRAEEAETYRDGLYRMEYTDAELGAVTVSVLVAGGKIASVSLPEGKGDVDMEDADLAAFLKAFATAPDYREIDAVSGASQSCDLVKYAVMAALKKARE